MIVPPGRLIDASSAVKASKEKICFAHALPAAIWTIRGRRPESKSWFTLSNLKWPASMVTSLNEPVPRRSVRCFDRANSVSASVGATSGSLPMTYEAGLHCIRKSPALMCWCASPFRISRHSPFRTIPKLTSWFCANRSPQAPFASMVFHNTATGRNSLTSSANGSIVSPGRSRM